MSTEWSFIKGFYCITFQKAIKEKKLDLWELDKDVLGTDREQKVPHGSGK